MGWQAIKKAREAYKKADKELKQTFIDNVPVGSGVYYKHGQHIVEVEVVEVNRYNLLVRNARGKEYRIDHWRIEGII